MSGTAVLGLCVAWRGFDSSCARQQLTFDEGTFPCMCRWHHPGEFALPVHTHASCLQVELFLQHRSFGDQFLGVVSPNRRQGDSPTVWWMLSELTLVLKSLRVHARCFAMSLRTFSAYSRGSAFSAGDGVYTCGSGSSWQEQPGDWYCCEMTHAHRQHNDVHMRLELCKKPVEVPICRCIQAPTCDASSNIL